MSECEKCTHLDVCFKIKNKVSVKTEEVCEYFCDSTKFFVLPCAIGDTVYRRRKNGNSITQYNDVDLNWIVNHIEEFGVNCHTDINDVFPKIEPLVDGKQIKSFASKKGVFLWQIAAVMGFSEATMTRKLRKGVTEEEKQKMFTIITELAKGGAE